MKKEYLGEHTIYGEWPTQIIVYEHPNGIHATVFLIGPGVEKYKDGMLTKEVNQILDKYDTSKEVWDNLYDLL